ncbi:hypothetical protein PR048_017874 [Dryococelus australis]|uniref:Uncharacterized protein n=1 Tax=Dryococelus australis TaxID=614101 RepID=A0ABQ9HBB3_9NEOP|nr:hypothetical protein PR048_017874 [Dryococelus australis]
MGLLVDVVRQGRATTNDDNISRRCFENPKKYVEITRVDGRLIHRLSVILKALSCGYNIDTEAFRKYAFETAQMYVKLYSWFYMPASVHKILIHGSDIMDDMNLPIGQLSEDVQEDRHKEYRLYREHHTRKVSRESTTEYLLHILLISSEPVISILRPLPGKISYSLSSDVLKLLTPCVEVSVTDESETVSDHTTVLA